MKMQIAVLLLLAVNAYGEVFNDGLEHTIDYFIADSNITISDEPFWLDPTTVNFYNAGRTVRIDVFGFSVFNMYSGNVDRLTLNNNSIGTIYGGTVENWAGVDHNGKGSLIILDCYFTGDQEILSARNGTTIIHKMTCLDTATVTGHPNHLTIFATDITVNGRDYQESTLTTGGIIVDMTGKWLDGTPFAFRFGGSMIIQPETVPYCLLYNEMDFNRDCRVDIADFAEFASQWMTCNLYPQSYCF